VLVPFIGILLPLLMFAVVAAEMREDGVLPFDLPMLHALHRLAGPALDNFFQWMSMLGYQWGVVPVDVLIFLGLIWARRYRDGLFCSLSVLGSLAINIAAKAAFGRLRPELWFSLAPETGYSFPSGHAMGSATLAMVVCLLAWRTQWRWPVVVVSVLFVLSVGLSRIYLGVHYPSDILAGWAAAVAWVVAMRRFHRELVPPSARNAVLR
jgi:undecaprenyl-diphosphatase